MTRRDFLAALGVSIGAVQWLAPDAPESHVTFYPCPVDDGPKTILLHPAPALAKTSLEQGFRVGDVFTISNRFAVNPVTMEPTRHLQRFIVTDLAVDRIGLRVWPTLVEEGRAVAGPHTYYWPKGITWPTPTGRSLVPHVNNLEVSRG